MKISAIEITDVLGTKRAKFSPGSVTIVSGGNGSGKSSILKAIAKLFEGGHDASMIRKGARRGAVHAALDTGTDINLTITPSGTTLEITNSEGMVIPGPRKFMDSLGESMAVDPGKLLGLDASTAGGKKVLTAAILEAMPVSFTPEEIPEAACGLMTGTGLEDLAKARKGIEETRRRIGVEVRDSDGAVRDLRKGLPGDDEEGTDWAAVAKDKAAVLAGHDRALQEKKSLIVRDEGDRRSKVIDEFAAREAELLAAKHAALNEAQASMNAAISEAEAEARTEHDRLSVEAATARERASQADRVEGMRETITQLEKKWRGKSDEYDKLTVTLEALDAARKSKLDSLPVAGLEFDGDNVLVDGVEWQNVNTARRVSVALQLCGLRAGSLPFLILDDSEHLDAAVWAAIRAAATEGGFQLVAARVSSEGPLKIETDILEAVKP